MAKKTVYRGSVSLPALNHETIIHKGQKGIFIPVENNPAIYFKVKPDGSKVINLDIEVTPTPQNQYGNSHYIRLNVGKENRQKYGISNDKIKDYSPIVGNLKAFEFEDRQGGQQGAATDNASDDLPPAGPTPQEFDPTW